MAEEKKLTAPEGDILEPEKDQPEDVAEIEVISYGDR